MKAMIIKQIVNPELFSFDQYFEQRNLILDDRVSRSIFF